MANTIYLNFGLSDRLLNYIVTTYPNAHIVEHGNTYVIIDVSLMTVPEQNGMKNDIASRIVEQI